MIFRFKLAICLVGLIGFVKSDKQPDTTIMPTDQMLRSETFNIQVDLGAFELCKAKQEHFKFAYIQVGSVYQPIECKDILELLKGEEEKK